MSLKGRIMPQLQIDAETGVDYVSLSIGGIDSASVFLSWSDDGGHTFSSEYLGSMGDVGAYKARIIWRRLGYSRDRVYRLSCADAVKKVFMNAYENGLRGRSIEKVQIDAETGVGSYTGNNPQASLSWSDDGGHTFSSEYHASLGPVGQYKTRLIWRRVGYTRDRVYRLTCSEPVKKVFMEIYEENTKEQRGPAANQE